MWQKIFRSKEFGEVARARPVCSVKLFAGVIGGAVKEEVSHRFIGLSAVRAYGGVGFANFVKVASEGDVAGSQLEKKHR